MNSFILYIPVWSKWAVPRLEFGTGPVLSDSINWNWEPDLFQWEPPPVLGQSGLVLGNPSDSHFLYTSLVMIMPSSHCYLDMHKYQPTCVSSIHSLLQKQSFASLDKVVENFRNQSLPNCCWIIPTSRLKNTQLKTSIKSYSSK